MFYFSKGRKQKKKEETRVRKKKQSLNPKEKNMFYL